MGHRPLKKFGQNFLTHPSIANEIVEALAISKEDTILEIGPGHGILTDLIIQKNPLKFIAIEIDRNLIKNLQIKYSKNIQLIENDFLNFNFNSLKDEKILKVIGNIPYNITSPILFKLQEYHSLIDRTVLMMQKEVARRVSAKPGNKDFGILSIMNQIYSSIEYLFEVKNVHFKPVPKVDSSVVRINYFKEVNGIENISLFKSIVRGVFNQRRKMLRNTLSRIFDQTIVTSLSTFDLTKRPEQLSIEEFKQLANCINQMLRQSA